MLGHGVTLMPTELAIVVAYPLPSVIHDWFKAILHIMTSAASKEPCQFLILDRPPCSRSLGLTLRARYDSHQTYGW